MFEIKPGLVPRLAIAPNGPAIKGGCVTRRKHRAESWIFSRETVTVQGRYGACFCRHGRMLVEHYECRGTRLIGVREIVIGCSRL